MNQSVDYDEMSLSQLLRLERIKDGQVNPKIFYLLGCHYEYLSDQYTNQGNKESRCNKTIHNKHARRLKTAAKYFKLAAQEGYPDAWRQTANMYWYLARHEAETAQTKEAREDVLNIFSKAADCFVRCANNGDLDDGLNDLCQLASALLVEKIHVSDQVMSTAEVTRLARMLGQAFSSGLNHLE